MRTQWTAVWALAILTAWPLANARAEAPAQGDGLMQRIKQADADEDGQVTFEEAQQAFPGVSREQYDAYDKNGDGVVSAADRAHGPKPGQGAAKGRDPHMFQRLDTNGDKKVTFEELSAVAPKMTKERFAHLDTNGDGVLTEGEGPKGRPGPPQAGRPEGAGPMMAKMRQADSNGDKQVTYEELKAVAPDMTKEQFVQFDTNGDGVLSEADTPATGAPAGRRPGPGGELFAKLRQADSDGDKKVTFEEATAVAPNMTKELFGRLDRNGDGVLSEADASATGAPGGRRPGPGAEMLAKLRQADSDGDNKVTFEELSAVAPNMTKERFGRLDRNGDGVLSEADVPTTGAPAGKRPGPGGELFAKLRKADSDGDGKVTFEEASAGIPDMTKDGFKALDINNDGVLSPADEPDTGPMTPPSDAPAPGPPHQRGRLAMLQGADKDGDSKVTFEELSAAMPSLTRERFDKFDQDGDGVLTPADGPKGGPSARDRRGDFLVRLKKSDADGDGKVTFEEIRADKPEFPKDAFDRMDRNGDGFLSDEDKSGE